MPDNIDTKTFYIAVAEIEQRVNGETNYVKPGSPIYGLNAKDADRLKAARALRDPTDAERDLEAYRVLQVAEAADADDEKDEKDEKTEGEKDTTTATPPATRRSRNSGGNGI